MSRPEPKGPSVADWFNATLEAEAKAMEGHTLTEAEKATVRHYYPRGVAAQSIAKALDKPFSTVKNFIVADGLHSPRRGNHKNL